mmetsp:Transcript_1675/g.3220  ORF Transcript_1675/g.3220 Transcript_1675/m.3220 type:complete len:237 (+) Transcript_1675:917-1627(+)
MRRGRSSPARRTRAAPPPLPSARRSSSTSAPLSAAERQSASFQRASPTMASQCSSFSLARLRAARPSSPLFCRTLSSTSTRTPSSPTWARTCSRCFSRRTLCSTCGCCRCTCPPRRRRPTPRSWRRGCAPRWQRRSASRSRPTVPRTCAGSGVLRAPKRRPQSLETAGRAEQHTSAPVWVANAHLRLLRVSKAFRTFFALVSSACFGVCARQMRTGCPGLAAETAQKRPSCAHAAN